MLFNTIRIAAHNSTGTIGVGTGFFFDYIVAKNKSVRYIITNKHVIESSEWVEFELNEREIVNGADVPSGTHITVKLEKSEADWIAHPDGEVDLCAMPFHSTGLDLHRQGVSIFDLAIGSNAIPTDEELAGFSVASRVLMVGYPNGLFDDVNNFPIVRQGITASHPLIDYQGRSEGVVDIACFPGSSGSPIMLPSQENMQLGEPRLLGVLYAGPVMNAEGEIVIRNVPTSVTPISVTELMIHLGYYVKAKEVLVLAEHGKELLVTQGRAFF